MKCPRTWYMKYVQKIPGIEDLKYAHRGQVLHKCLESYFNNEFTTINELEKYFNDLWFNKYKLQTTSLKNNKEETWNMVMNGLNLDIKPTTNELKLYFHDDVVAYLDMFDSKNRIAGDYKSSTRSYENEKEYTMQGKFYSWLVYRKFGYLLKEFIIYYLKYNGDKGLLVVKPKMSDLEAAKKWHYKIKERMQYFIDNPNKLPRFNQDFFFCPYKHLWDIDKKKIENRLLIDIDYYGNYFYIKGDLDNDLLRTINDEFSYEKNDAYYIKQKYPHIDTIVRLFSVKYKRLPTGLYHKFIEFITNVSKNMNKFLILNVNDKRYFDNKRVDMPRCLLTGKILKEEQENATEYFINKNNHCIIEFATGVGKTLLATEIIRRLGVKTLIIVNKRNLLYQFIKVLEDELGIEIGIIGDGKKNIRDITVATIQTLNKNKSEYKEYLESIRFGIFDEVHAAGSDSYYGLSHNLKNTQYRLGLSATPKRRDNSDLKMHAVTGYVGMTVKTNEAIDKGYLMKPEVNFIKYEVPKEELSMMDIKSSAGLINEEKKYVAAYPVYIKDNKIRNGLIKQIVTENEGKNILILVKLVQHGKKLEQEIDGSFYLYGETNNKERNEMMDKFNNDEQKILISTDSIFSEGVDVPGLEVLINASANKTDIRSIQILGRVLRKKEGKNQAIYYDFIDNFSFFRPASSVRMKAFKGEGHNVNIIEK